MSAVPNPAAFPSVEEHPSYDFPMHHPGMTLRDYFAGQALAGILASRKMIFHDQQEMMARHAFEHADAMLAERARAGAA